MLYSVAGCTIGMAALGVYAASRRRQALRGAFARLPHDVHITATSASGEKVAMDAPRLTMDPTRERIGFILNAIFLGGLGALVGSELGFVTGGVWARRTMAREGDLVRRRRVPGAADALRVLGLALAAQLRSLLCLPGRVLTPWLAEPDRPGVQADTNRPAAIAGRRARAELGRRALQRRHLAHAHARRACEIETYKAPLSLDAG